MLSAADPRAAGPLGSDGRGGCTSTHDLRSVRSALDGKPRRYVVGRIELVNAIMAHARKRPAAPWVACVIIEVMRATLGKARLQPASPSHTRER